MTNAGRGLWSRCKKRIAEASILTTTNREGEMRQLISIVMAALLLTTSSLAFAADVYVTKNGKKYHTQECRWVKNRETVKMSEEDAVKKGYEPCGKCIKKDNDK